MNSIIFCVVFCLSQVFSEDDSNFVLEAKNAGNWQWEPYPPNSEPSLGNAEPGWGKPGQGWGNAEPSYGKPEPGWVYPEPPQQNYPADLNSGM